MVDQINLRGIYDLPIEVCHLVCEYLSLRDLVNMRLVSKWFAVTVDEFRMERLVIGEPFQDYSSYYTYKPFRYQDMYQPLNSNLVQSFFSRPIFKNLKYLNLACPRLEFDLEALNQLNQLEHLEITYLKIRRTIELNLPSLQILAISTEEIVGENDGIIINSHRLHAFNCGDHCLFSEKAIHFTHPSSIEFIEVNSVYDRPYHKTDLAPFVNLKIYKQDNVNVKDDILSILPAGVEELHFNKVKLNDDSKTYIANVMKQKKILKKTNLKIYLMGVQLLDTRTFENYDFDSFDYEDFYGIDFHLENYDFYANNYSLLADTLPFIKHINYDDVLQYGIKNDFFRRFKNIQYLNVHKVIDQSALVKFISNLKNLSLLSIDELSLNQVFYDQLAKISSLQHLFLDADKDYVINFEFICKLKSLVGFGSHTLAVPLDIAARCFKSCKYLNNFEFQDKEKTRISRYNSKINFMKWTGSDWLQADSIVFRENDLSIDQLEKLCHNLIDKKN